MTASLGWSADQYRAFEDERTRPARDLLNAVGGAPVRTAIDLGCGPGNSTECLRARFPTARITGLDSSAEMIAAARARLPDIAFELGTIDGWTASPPVDVILANAVLHWLPAHDRLLPRLVRQLAPSGSFAMQVPDNLDAPAHSLMREVAARGPWADRLGAAMAARAPLPSAHDYYALLKPLCRGVDVWHTIYNHPLRDGVSGIVEWFKGSGLRPFLQPLTPDERRMFLDAYSDALGDAYPTTSDGTVLLPFPRLFVVAAR